MISPQLLDDIVHHLKNSSGVLVLTHQDPDFDAIGSSLAWCLQLQKFNIPFHFFVADKTYSQFQFLPGSEFIRPDFPRSENFDTVLILDSSNLDRIRKWDELGITDDGTVTIINIDHHQDNRKFGNFNIVENISSVGELTCLLFSMAGWEMTADQATCLYSAILYDTGSFLNSNVTPSTYRASATLLENGANTALVTQNMYENITETDYQALKLMLDELVVEHRIAYSLLPAEFPTTSLKLIQYIRQLSGIDVALLFRAQDNGLVRISLRSKTQFSVSKFSALFNGGGHHRASGIVLPGTLETVSQQVLERLRKVMSDPQFYVS
jgi:phosphoesterase RecJ-like protein